MDRKPGEVDESVTLILSVNVCRKTVIFCDGYRDFKCVGNVIVGYLLCL